MSFKKGLLYFFSIFFLFGFLLKGLFFTRLKAKIEASNPFHIMSGMLPRLQHRKAFAAAGFSEVERVGIYPSP